MNDAPRRLIELLEGLEADLVKKVFTHSSWTDDRALSYERLAFLGDGVLGMVIAEVLLKQNPAATAGELTKIRAQAASRTACARVGRDLGIEERLAANAPTTADLPVEDVLGAQSVVAESCEAVIGAVFVQYGYREAAVAVAEAFAGEMATAASNPTDYKSTLQELLARRGQKPAYVLTDSDGPPHDRSFSCAVEIRGDRYGTGSGRSKKEAEQAAAGATLELLERPETDQTAD